MPLSVDLDLCLEAMCLAKRSLSENIWPQMGQTNATSDDAEPAALSTTGVESNRSRE